MKSFVRRYNNRFFSISGFSTTSTTQPLPRLRVVLDVDECMVHSLEKIGWKIPRGYDHTILPFKDGNMLCIERPQVREALKLLNEHVDIYAYSAGVGYYVNAVVDHLDPNRDMFKKVFHRQSCFFVEPLGCFTKDISIIEKDFQPQRTLLVDNAWYSFLVHPNNGYLVKHFEANNKTKPDDDDFFNAAQFIVNNLTQESDIRPILIDKFNLVHEIKQYLSRE